MASVAANVQIGFLRIRPCPALLTGVPDVPFKPIDRPATHASHVQKIGSWARDHATPAIKGMHFRCRPGVDGRRTRVVGG
jgi:hypothetical protein